MGAILPKPATTKLLERTGSDYYRMGCACVNGYRENMEDAHLCDLHGTWAMFGIFDGHVNASCSEFTSEEWRKQMQTQAIPMSDERMKELSLQIDKKFLDTGSDGGSTGTFFISEVKGKTIHLQVGNVGDSRVLIGKNGDCVAMTTDHKPSLEVEHRRIEECGGKVENNRVDGSLAVSRAYGDPDYKRNSGGGELNQKVIALPEVTHIDLDFPTADFALLACDGVFEGQFSNEEVILFVTEKLKNEKDLALVAAAVCEEAINRGSKDNISCMIVQFVADPKFGAGNSHEVVPGPFSAPQHKGFRRVYELMATKGGVSVGYCLESRFDTLALKKDTLSGDEQSEFECFKNGPPSELKGTERTAWFTNWFNALAEEAEPVQGTGNLSAEQIRRMQLVQEHLGIPLPLILELMQNGGA